MTAKSILEAILLAGVVLSCWLSVLGMLRMRTPTEALHFLALPSCIAAPLLTLAILVHNGFSSVTWKMLFITGMLLGINAVVVHATARAFRTRELGHWEPLPEDHVPMAPAQEPHA